MADFPDLSRFRELPVEVDFESPRFAIEQPPPWAKYLPKDYPIKTIRKRLLDKDI